MEFLARLTGKADRLLTKLLALALILALCYGGYALWDTYQVYMGASVDGDLLKFKPVLNAAGESNPTLSELIAINPDVRAWLTVNDTHIDYPLLQGMDNVRYVNVDVYGNFALSGSIFLDFRNAPDFSDFYSLVYGHHMSGGAMFGDLEHFLEEAYFDAHKTGNLFLLDRTYDIELFACLQVDAFDEYVFDPHYDRGGSQPGEREQAMLDYLREKAVFYRELEQALTVDDRIIGLSTCSEASTNARTVVFGRLRERAFIQEKITPQEGGNTELP